jgi:hypothetical protein
MMTGGDFCCRIKAAFADIRIDGKDLKRYGDLNNE